MWKFRICRRQCQPITDGRVSKRGKLWYNWPRLGATLSPGTAIRSRVAEHWRTVTRLPELATRTDGEYPTPIGLAVAHTMETLKPALRVLAHAEMRGAQMGSAAGLVLVLPRGLYHGKAPTIGGAACMAGAGAVVGGAVAGIYATVQMLRKEGDEIKMKADKICAAAKPVVDKASHAGAVIGVAYAVKRVVNISKVEGIPISKIIGSRRGPWIIISYAALGVGVVVVAAAVAKGGHVAVKKIREKVLQKDDGVAKAAAEVVNGAADAATEAEAVVDDAVRGAEEGDK